MKYNTNNGNEINEILIVISRFIFILLYSIICFFIIKGILGIIFFVTN